MNSRFYLRLAKTNISKNRNIYTPYHIAATLIVMLFYCLISVTTMVAKSDSSTMAFMLGLCTVICGIMSLVILFYINCFVMRRRKHEFGLYSILGMEKRHIARVMMWEVVLTGLFCIIAGIVCGAVFSQFFFLLLMYIVKLPTRLSFTIPLGGVGVTFLLFAAGFAIVLLYDVLSLRRTDPIALMRSGKEGEREPKARWLVALIGLVTLGAGYTLALTVKTGSEALMAFFPAVLLVIAGTYSLFIAGSIALLKLLRKNKNFYYRPKNFISVSGMIYRMKQNAVGLSNICILSTCVLVTLSSTVCLFIGEEDILRSMYPRDVAASCVANIPADGDKLREAAEDHAKAYGLSLENPTGFYRIFCPGVRSGDSFEVQTYFDNSTYQVYLTTLEDYNRNTGSAQTLGKDEVLAAVYGEPLQGTTLSIAGHNYRIAQEVDLPAFVGTADKMKALVVVLPSFEALQTQLGEMNANLSDDDARVLFYHYQYDTAGGKAVSADYYDTMYSDFAAKVPTLSRVQDVNGARNEFYQLYGTLLFVGIFFVALFLICAVLIIYYKQITEGFDDHDRFRIMKNVGLSDAEVRSTISKQVLLVFFLPLLTAVLHISVAFPVLLKLLMAFNMANTPLFLGCTAGSVLCFSALYLVVYRLTSRTYYRIVQA